GRRALLIFGSGHLMRESAYGRSGRSSREKPNVTELLEKEHPGSVFAIWPHSGNWGEVSKADSRLRSWPVPALASLAGTWLGQTTVGPRGTPRMQELADALLYLGPIASLSQSKPADTLYADPSYLTELLRRDRI